MGFLFVAHVLEQLGLGVQQQALDGGFVGYAVMH